ncbi:MurR/RpiR family transcriptional regulator [Arenivirga flava]|uniref:MurR/RpiR family transcriptional regulator n=1 Tax=Arenivirga flava TaxID=1930060 RepID=UPI0024E04864|nr:MurR/RpiR family transcriptional regulator [Arenivirga flava]
MTWSAPQDAPPTVRIAAHRSTMLPSERRVADAIAAQPATLVELTAQELAERIGVARTTVIRASQSLGYAGYTQLRLALTKELARSVPAPRTVGEGMLGRLRADVEELASGLHRLASTLDEASMQRAVELVAAAPRVLVFGSGLSATIAEDLSMRLTGIGRTAEYLLDPISQQIAAVQLRDGDVALLVSGSGATQSSLAAARAVAESQGSLVLITSFARSPIAELADVRLVVGPVQQGFRDELVRRTRVPHSILVEFLVDRVGEALGPEAAAMHLRAIGILADNIGE